MIIIHLSFENSVPMDEWFLRRSIFSCYSKLETVMAILDIQLKWNNEVFFYSFIVYSFKSFSLNVLWFHRRLFYFNQSEAVIYHLVSIFCFSLEQNEDFFFGPLIDHSFQTMVQMAQLFLRRLKRTIDSQIMEFIDYYNLC